ncbi:hypothetical protein ACFLZW_03000 [Chloroflexota bacterium]
MREWKLKPGDPLSLTLANDIRLGPTDYYNDHIWELSIGAGDPPALAIHTTYGLRAKALRLFPRFLRGEEVRTDPNAFISKPVIKRIYTNYLEVGFSPFEEIDVTLEYWVPQSQAITGRISLENKSKVDQLINLEWVAQLSPNEGQRMATTEMQAALVLSGKSDGLAPVVFLTGGPKTGGGSYPSLSIDIPLEPSAQRQVAWSQAALSNSENSFTLARKLAAQQWDSELSRLHMLNAGLIEIYTGDPDWDAALMLTQKEAYGLFVGPTGSLDYPSHVQVRLPDQGFSLRGDGSDYNHLWNGQSPLEVYYLINLILPSAPELAKGLLLNFLSTQDEDGFIDNKPGLGGQRSSLLATPILSSITWRIYQISEDRSFLEEAYPKLVKFLENWFTPRHDRDGDGIPEWDHPIQTGIDDHPIFSYWHDWSPGIDITTVESPALCAFLYREFQMLKKIAATLERGKELAHLESLSERLIIAVQDSWNKDDQIFQDWDRDTHYSDRGELLVHFFGAGILEFNKHFQHPVRIQVQILSTEIKKSEVKIFIHGSSASGNHRVERIDEKNIKWQTGRGIITGGHVYSKLEKVDIQGLGPEDQILLHTIGYDYFDHTLLSPLWAGMIDKEQAGKLIENTILKPDLFWLPYGLPVCPRPPENAQTNICFNSNFLWSLLTCEGLLHYGYRGEATELVIRMMTAIIATLKQDGAFRRAYRADTGQGNGERNALAGLAPLGLFLETLGIRLISPHRLAIQGENLFPWAVTVKYRGMTIIRQSEKTFIIFPDGQSINIDDPDERIISLE